VTETFWEIYFRQAKITLIQSADVSQEEAEEFFSKFSKTRDTINAACKTDFGRDNEEVEDLLDMM